MRKISVCFPEDDAVKGRVAGDKGRTCNLLK